MTATMPGSSRAEGDAARDLVMRFMSLCADRRIDEADALLAPGAVLEFPGGARHTSVRTMADAARQRYQSISKESVQCELARAGGGVHLVVCTGYLRGTDLAGHTFGGVRFVDIFEVVSRRVRSQRVWNDLAEAGITGAGHVPGAGEGDDNAG